MSKKAYLFLADGFEEVEALTQVDFLRRSGIDVTTVAVGKELGELVSGGHGIDVRPDMYMHQLQADSSDYDALILPGGMPGAANLAADQNLRNLLIKGNNDGKLVCAICAAPAVVLGNTAADILGTRNFTCYPGFEERTDATHLTRQRVEIDGNLITSMGAGTAAEFAVAIIRRLTDDNTADTIHSSTLQK